MVNISAEKRARQKIRAAARLLEDAVAIYDGCGQIYGGPALNAEVLRPIVEELSARSDEADRLVPLIG